MVATLSHVRVKNVQGKVNLCTFLELAMDRSKTAQDEPVIHRHCHNFRPLDHNAIPPAIPPFHDSAIPPFCNSAIPLPLIHSTIQLPFNHSAIPPFHPPFRHLRHSTIPPFRPPFRHLCHSTIPPLLRTPSTFLGCLPYVDSSITIVRMYLKLTINAMVVTPFSCTHVERTEKGEPSHLLRACDG